jgi:hypothetical protein
LVSVGPVLEADVLVKHAEEQLERTGFQAETCVGRRALLAGSPAIAFDIAALCSEPGRGRAVSIRPRLTDARREVCVDVPVITVPFCVDVSIVPVPFGVDVAIFLAADISFESVSILVEIAIRAGISWLMSRPPTSRKQGQDHDTESSGHRFHVSNHVIPQ